MWRIVLGAIVGAGSKLMGYELDTKEALLVVLIAAVLFIAGNRERQS